jgi:hypothetical protein
MGTLIQAHPHKASHAVTDGEADRSPCSTDHERYESDSGNDSTSPNALSWHPSVSRRGWELGSRVGGGGSGKWLVQRAGVGL